MTNSNSTERRINPFFLGASIVFLSCAWPFLHLMSSNIDVAFHFGRIITYSIYVTVAAFCLFLVLCLVTNKKVSPEFWGVLLGGMLVLTFVFGALEGAVEGVVGKDNHGGKITIALLGLFYVGVFVTAIIGRKKQHVAIVVFVMLVVLNLGPVVKLSFSVPDLVRQANVGDGGEAVTDSIKTKHGGLPEHNVYYFIFDAYAREDVLAEHFGINNLPFLSKLENLGFVVDHQSFSNYATTYRTISTSFNMDYYIKKNGIYDVNILQNGGRAVEELKKSGYRFIYVESGGVEALTCGSAVDHCVEGSSVNQVFRVLANMTPLWRIVNSSFFVKTFDVEGMFQLTEVVPAIENVLNNGAEGNSPYFAFIHILSPHEPARYDENCDRLGVLNPAFYDEGTSEKARESRRKIYANDLKCLNEKILQTVDLIFAIDKSDPIILLQSDHGARFDLIRYDIDPIVRLKNLMATHLPESCTNWLPEHITPVNNFRFVLNCIHGGGVQYLKDEFYQLNFPEKNSMIDSTEMVQSVQERELKPTLDITK